MFWGKGDLLFSVIMIFFCGFGFCMGEDIRIEFFIVFGNYYLVGFLVYY